MYVVKTIDNKQVTVTKKGINSLVTYYSGAQNAGLKNPERQRYIWPNNFTSSDKYMSRKVFGRPI